MYCTHLNSIMHGCWFGPAHMIFTWKFLVLHIAPHPRPLIIITQLCLLNIMICPRITVCVQETRASNQDASDALGWRLRKPIHCKKIAFVTRIITFDIVSWYVPHDMQPPCHSSTETTDMGWEACLDHRWLQPHSGG